MTAETDAVAAAQAAEPEPDVNSGQEQLKPPLRERLRTARRVALLIATTGFRAAPGAMSISLVTGVLAAVCQVSYSIGYRVIVDGAVRGDAAFVVAGACLVGALFTTGWALGIINAMRNSVLSDRVNLRVGGYLAELANAPEGLEHFENPKYYDQVELLRNSRRALAGAPRQLIAVIQLAVRSLVIIVLLATIYPPVLLVPALALAPMLADKRAARLQARNEEEQAADRRLLTDLFQLATTAQHARELRVYGLTEPLAERHHALGEQLRRAGMRAALRSAAWETLGWIVFAAGFGVAVVLLTVRAVHGEISIGQVVMAVSLLRRAQSQVSTATDTSSSFATAIRAAGRLVWLEDYAARARRDASALGPAPDALAEGIRFEDVEFAYPNAAHPALCGVNLFLPAGATVAVVGDNGAGKTTLVKLLTGMYQPTAGRILLDSTELGAIDPESWRARIRATFQDYVPYQFTAGRVVGVGDLPYLDDEEAVSAAVADADASALVKQLPKGLRTQVGRYFKGGRELSGGQWHKLALARGLMRREPLLTVLDEPTASLDAAAESALFARYTAAADHGAARGAITLLVSHRFSTVHTADLVVVVEQGRITEFGTHDDLLAANGLYARLHAIQAAPYLDDYARTTGPRPQAPM